MSKATVRTVYQHARDLGLSKSERDVLAAMAAVMADSRSLVTLSKAEVAARAGVSAKTVQRAWRSLASRGLIQQVGRQPCANGFVPRWRIPVCALPVDKSASRGVRLSPVDPGRGDRGGSEGGQNVPHNVDIDLSIVPSAKASGPYPVDNFRKSDSESFADAHDPGAFDLQAPPGQYELPLVGVLDGSDSEVDRRRAKIEQEIVRRIGARTLLQARGWPTDSETQRINALVLELARLIEGQGSEAAERDESNRRSLNQSPTKQSAAVTPQALEDHRPERAVEPEQSANLAHCPPTQCAAAAPQSSENRDEPPDSAPGQCDNLSLCLVRLSAPGAHCPDDEPDCAGSADAPAVERRIAAAGLRPP